MIEKTHACTSSLFPALNTVAYTILIPELRDVVLLDELRYQHLMFYVAESCHVPSSLQHAYMFLYAILNEILITSRKQKIFVKSGR